MTSEEKDAQFQLTGKPIVEEGMMTIEPAHGVAEVKIFLTHFPRIPDLTHFYFLISGRDCVLLICLQHQSGGCTEVHCDVNPLSKKTSEAWH